MKLYALIHLALLVLSAPWLFVWGAEEAGPLIWPIYSVAVCVIYAVFVAVSLRRLWPKAREGGGDDGR